MSEMTKNRRYLTAILTISAIGDFFFGCFSNSICMWAIRCACNCTADKHCLRTFVEG